MKQLYFIITVLFAMTWQITYSAETEPNNIAAQANSLTLNGSNTGKLDPPGDTDWWKITTVADGKLNITLSTFSGKSIWVYLYDNNSTTLLASDNSGSTFLLKKSDLAAGTYYIKVQCVSATDTASYTISNSVELPAEANDAEPNDSKAQALALPLNSSATGHVGYYYNNKRDTADWYKITTNKDGKLEFNFTPVSGTNTWVYLYDNDGITLLNAKDSNVAFTLSTDGLASGTYYVKVNCSSNSKFTSYILTNNLVTISQAIDAEPNNSKDQAVALTLNTTKTGRIGYYYNNKRDTTDWYKITTIKDGKLEVKLTPVNGANIWASLYDNNGITLLNSKDSNIAFTLSTDGLATGTYYLKINCSDVSQFTPYILANKSDTVTQANDAEPNNSKAEAVVLALNSTQTGHVGYYYKNKRDTADWYQVTTDKNGKLDITLTPVNGSNTWVYLYDKNGTTLLNSKDSNATFTLITDGLAAGVYFVKIICSDDSKFTAYTLTNNLAIISQANDTEPNNNPAQALTLSLNSKRTGYVGYYYNNKRDTSDWYKFTTTADTKVKLKLLPANGQFVTVSLYAGNGTSLISSSSNNKNFSLTTDGLEDDVYYVKINSKASDGFTPYTLWDSVFVPTTDTLILPLNYRITDTLQTNGDVDWFKVTTNADGKLNFTLTPVSNKFVWIYLYDHDGTTLLNSTYSNSVFKLGTDGLAAGTYYVKVFAFYSSDTTRYLLADTLSVYSQANDVEPNNTKAQAITLNLNSSKTGNVGYLYNNKRDTADWYKLTTNADGLLSLSLTPVNGSFVWVYLYDNDGTTLLKSTYDNVPFTLTRDGLAAGTYYVKINCYYSNQFSPYALSNKLTLPAEANDTEPNNSLAQATTFKVNATVTGHTGYYYNNKRDTTDWYKITTTAEGLLNLSLTPANGSFVYVYLYDNDGVTELKAGYNNVPFTVTRDGLAAGTYYIKVNCYYSYEFTPYTLTNALVKPVVANDAEPNNTRAAALTLNVNSTTSGHVGYYYNNKRDSADWYKITTTKNGLLKLRLTPANGAFIYAYLYDNDGTTELNSSYANSAFVQNTDGLAAGTYYVKVKCYYNNDFTPYTLTDSLFTYAYANDAEPNKYPYQGNVVSPNTTVTGHVNFYYKLAKDSLDWWKLNYTGTGSLQFIFNLAPKKINGEIPYTWFYLYKDTLAAPVYANYFNTASNAINLSSLSKANYYIRIITYYKSDFVTYSFSNSFVVPAPPLVNALQRGTVENKPVTAGGEVTVYPNPVSNRLHIQANSKHINLASVILRDANGKQVWGQKKWANVLQGSGLDINVTSFPQGAYYLQITDINGKSTIKK